MFVEWPSLKLKMLIFLKMAKIVPLIPIVNQMFAFINCAMETKKTKSFVFKIMTAKAFFAMIISALKLSLKNLL